MSGFVSLVGAGPGDPALLTRAAAVRLRRADLLLYDALIPSETIALARRARRFPVGKRADHPGIGQEAINRLMIRAARRGLEVVRLKGGDPFVFGRGGEEALALRRAGVRFEIIPGVTSAIAAPALARIPVTHRGLSSAFLTIAGHSPAAYAPVLRSIAPNSLTIVVLMGLASRTRIAQTLILRGWSPDTPVAILSAASWRNSDAWIGSLRTIAEFDDSSGLPGTIVIGDTVHLAATLSDAQAGVAYQGDASR